MTEAEKVWKVMKIKHGWTNQPEGVDLEYFEDIVKATRVELLGDSERLLKDKVIELKNQLLLNEQALKDDVRMSFEEPSNWSHSIAKVRAKIELLDHIQKVLFTTTHG